MIEKKKVMTVFFLFAVLVLGLAVYCEVLRAKVDNLVLFQHQMAKKISETNITLSIEAWKGSGLESAQEVADMMEIIRKAPKFEEQDYIISKLGRVLDGFAQAEAIEYPIKDKKTELQVLDIKELAIGRASNNVKEGRWRTGDL